MKKLLLPVILCFVGMAAAAQEFSEGDRRVDLTIGVGTIPGSAMSATSFDQHFSMEWGIGRVMDKVTVGLGFSINNTYGSFGDRRLIGTYDYYYTNYVNSGVIDYNKENKVHRYGVGTADARLSREDINAQVTVSFHYSPMPRLDVYSKIGAGFGVMNYLIGDPYNADGFSQKTVDKTNSQGTYHAYSYNDLDHVEWQGLDSKVVPAISVYLGATYYLNSRWGVDAQIGLLSANLKGEKKGYPNSYSIFAVGASYKF